MPDAPTHTLVRQLDTLFSPLETTEQPAWLQRASAEDRRLLQAHRTQGREARRQAMQAFAPIQSLYTYNLTDLAPLDSAAVTPDVFYTIQHRQQLHERYPTYLEAMLDDTALRSAKQDAYLATLREEYTIAQIKGDVGKDGKRLLDWIIGALPSGSPEFTQSGPFFGPEVAVCSSLRLLDDLMLPGIILLGADTDDAPCVAYVPGHPEHPLKEYGSRLDFFASVRSALTTIEFQRFFLRFVPLRHQQRAMLAWLADDALLSLKMAAIPLNQGLRSFEQSHMIKRLLDDARFLIPTTPEQAVPLRDLYPLFVNALEEHLITGAGPGLSSAEEDEGRAPSDWIAPLRVIKPKSANYRRWLPDLSTYHLGADSLPTGQPDAQGLYRLGEHKAISINQAFYRVAQTNQGRWYILHPTDKEAYRPPLHHNGYGAWHHSLEQPQYWERLSLLRRLGPTVAGFEDERLLQLGRVSSTGNAELRQVYLHDKPIPALLAHVLQRARLFDEVARSMALIAKGLPVPEVDEVPQLHAFYKAVDIYLGKEPVPRRARRSNDPAPDGSDNTCDANCNPPPADLYNAWVVRLRRAIALHRFELAQLTTDHAVQELQRRYPHMPLSVAQQMLDDNQGRINMPLPLDLAEQANALDYDARLSNALEGFTQPSLINQDTFILAFRLLEYLDNWPAGTALLLRDGAPFGTPLAELGQTDVDTTSVYLDEDEGWHAVSSTQILLAQDIGEFGFYRALLYALGESRSARLGFGLNEPQRLHQRLMELALARPTRARLLLGMPVRRSWLMPHVITPAQRTPSSRDQNLFDREPVQTRLERLISHHQLTIPRRYVNAYITQLLNQRHPIGARVVQLERERAQLDDSLGTWLEQSTNSTIRFERTQVANQLIRAWESRITLSQGEVRIEGAILGELPPLPIILPRVIALRVMGLQHIDNLSTWLQQFPDLQRLELINLPLTEVPQGLENLRHLSHLDLSGTRLTPAYVSLVGALANLQMLVLNDIEVADFNWSVRHMTRLFSNRTLRTLTMQGSNASFSPGAFAVMHGATHLNLGQNRISLSEQDAIDLGNLPQLVSLDLSLNPLSRMPNMTGMLALEEVDLSYLSDAVSEWPQGLEQLPHIISADLRGQAIASVPIGAGRVRGLRMSSEFMTQPDRQRFDIEMLDAGNIMGDSDASTDPASDSDASTDVEPASVRHATTLHDAPGLFEGMAYEDQAHARQLLEDTGSSAPEDTDPSMLEFFAIMLRQEQRLPNGPKRDAMRRRIQALIRGAFNPALRESLYEQALEAVSCVDRDALVFSQMENLLQADLMLARADDAAAEGELLDMAISHWRALRLREHVTANLPAWRPLGHRIDYSEIELYFRIALTTRLGLRDQPSEQAFPEYAEWVTQAMLDHAVTAVIQDQMRQLPAYLYGQAYWQRYLDFAAVPQLQQVNRWKVRIGDYLDAVSCGELPPELSEDEQERVRDILHRSGYLELHQPLPAAVQLNSGQYRAAYDALLERIAQARMELTRTIVREPRPGPSSRS